ncbi:ABC transporter ATP-binding protein [Catellatospora tritici]|uniref:ABC transporter ATP-binding protein n=1 Tax=Catellatospora tritici TaxID=2851566 RepID=UPI001C2D81B5|nr:ABC transporter ATP-binding protein [Catellatospora tritici]MBV1851817.1 ABC transporter ATP-binding protein [Catellatospora tritici]
MLQLVDVTRAYPGGVTAVDGVGLTVRQGEFVAVVGPSGSGKSTLLHLVGLLDRPTAGTIRVAGYDTGALPDRSLAALRARAIGFVFQQFHLAPGVRALDAVADGLLYTGVARARRRDRAAETLHQVGLGERLTHRPHELSGGERQRVAIARALVKRPDVILADEPTGNLDSAAAETVLELLRELHAAGTTIVVITHDRGIADSLPRRVRMRDGRIVSADQRREVNP